VRVISSSCTWLNSKWRGGKPVYFQNRLSHSFSSVAHSTTTLSSVFIPLHLANNTLGATTTVHTLLGKHFEIYFRSNFKLAVVKMPLIQFVGKGFLCHVLGIRKSVSNSSEYKTLKAFWERDAVWREISIRLSQPDLITRRVHNEFRLMSHGKRGE